MKTLEQLKALNKIACAETASRLMRDAGEQLKIAQSNPVKAVGYALDNAARAAHRAKLFLQYSQSD